jgi:hypothetical protein
MDNSDLLLYMGLLFIAIGLLIPLIVLVAACLTLICRTKWVVDWPQWMRTAVESIPTWWEDPFSDPDLSPDPVPMGGGGELEEDTVPRTQDTLRKRPVPTERSESSSPTRA